MKTNQASQANFYHYNRNLKTRARSLRKRTTKGEKILWEMVRKRRMCNYLFTRQRPVLNYIVDIMCKELKLILESDGISHQTDIKQRQDRIRDFKLRKVGFTIIRFNDWEIINRPDVVHEAIKSWVEFHIKDSTPRPPSKGEA